MLPLTQATVGQQIRLVRINAGKKLLHRLTAMGLTPGVELRIIQDTGGPILLAVRDSRLALGRGMAHKMIVAPISNVLEKIRSHETIMYSPRWQPECR